MILRSERLPRGHQLPRDSRTALGEFFRMRFAPNNSQINRFAAITPKTLDRRAVARNRIQRIIYETIRSWPRSGKDVVITALKPASGRKKTELIQDLGRLQKNITPPSPL